MATDSSIYQAEDASFTYSYGDVSDLSDSEGKMVHDDVQETRLIIGVDYGTTYTGVASATVSGTRCDLNEISVKTGEGENEKVPSVIAYHNDKIQWGNDLPFDSVSMVHTKLELGPQKMTGELELTLQVLDGIMDLDFQRMFMHRGRAHKGPAYSSKSPEEIVTDYLSEIYEYVKQELQGSETALKNTTTDLVATVPSDWSYMAMNSTYRALMAAGFNQLHFPKLNVMFITEPEAAAVYTARYYRDEEEHEFLKEGEFFILCDAGGGTVDVVSYEVIKLRPLLQLEQIGGPTGDTCGSIFINLEFKKWLRRLLRIDPTNANEDPDKHYRKLDPNLDIEKVASHASETGPMRLLMKEFENKKKDFTMEPRNYTIDLPPPLEDLHLPGRVEKGLIRIPRVQMEDFFDKCITRIAKLIKEHVQRIEDERQGRPRNLFLVGGFAESEYLHAQIKDMLEVEGSIMEFRRPQSSWSAVVRGAVVCGIEKAGNKSLRYTNSCRHSYGISLDQIYSKRQHEEKDIVQIGGNTFAQKQLIWLLNKGDLVLSDKPCKKETTFDLRLEKLRVDVLKLPVYRYTDVEKLRPTRVANAKRDLAVAAELDIDLSKITFEKSKGQFLKSGGLEATLRIELELDWDVLHASLWWNKKLLSRVPVAY